MLCGCDSIVLLNLFKIVSHMQRQLEKHEVGSDCVCRNLWQMSHEDIRERSCCMILPNAACVHRKLTNSLVGCGLGEQVNESLLDQSAG